MLRYVLAMLVFACIPDPVAEAVDDDLLLLTSGARAAGGPAVVTRTVGPSGGVLRAGRVVVTIPPGALASPVPVTLRRAAPGADFGNQSALWSYALEIPLLQSGQDIDVALFGLGAPDRQAAVALGDSSTMGGQADTAPARVVWGSVTSGVLRFKLSAHDLTQGVLPTASGEGHASRWWTLAGYARKSSQHFTVEYPTAVLSVSADSPDRILAAAEDAYQKLANLNFDLAGSLAWPVPISVGYATLDEPCPAGLPLAGKGKGYLVLNAGLCAAASSDAMRAAVGHGLFHAVQAAYDPRSTLAQRHAASDPHFAMLREASSTWFERAILGGSYVSPYFLANMGLKGMGLETWQGMPQAQAQARNLGYWASGFVRSLVDQLQGQLVLGVWQNVRNQTSPTPGYSDLRALVEAAGPGGVAALNWADYMGRLFSGNTGYAGWPVPASDAFWLSSGAPLGRLSASLAPFSAQKWTVIIDSVPTGAQYMFSPISETPDLTYVIYKGTNPNGPFSYVATLKMFNPQMLATAPGDMYVIAAVNGESKSPYTTVSGADLLLGDKAKCRFCPEVPADAPMLISEDGLSRWWVDESYMITLAQEHYQDTQWTKLWSFYCSWPNVAAFKTGVRFRLDGTTVYDIQHYDTEGKEHGIWKEFYEAGNIHFVRTYAHGLILTMTEYDPDGGIIHYCTYDGQGTATCTP
ncbi:toxin-antitoxin system YwqK family antitoxin [Fundidesulfovibrio agrisoli]|uniref:toxin-antitoxin system YwqK family antitoxin n=1 Tax=Fundidesulfovibrio agrisoli TaxID=2922717 RepID=UPI001FAE247B|nr:hypothetical protein [Fundidesulfovibrio agrisoli]